MMAEDNAPSRGGSVSFSEMTELPPLKEVYIPPPPPPPPAFSQPASRASSSTLYEYEAEEKPKVQPREVAEKAIKEIKNVPPSLMVYSIAGAAVVILIIAVALVLHVNTLNSDGDTPRPAAESKVESTQPVATPPAARTQPAPAQPAQPAAVAQAQPPAPVAEDEPARTSTHGAAKAKNAKKKVAAAAAPLVVPGQMSIDSVPQGAQVSVDGKTDPSWVTPFTLPGLNPGQHSVTVSKPGYSSDTRTVEVTSGSKSFVVNHLSQLMATLGSRQHASRGQRLR